MTRRAARTRSERGYLLLPVVLMLVFVAAAAYMLTLQGGVGIESSARMREAREALLVARAGLEHASFEANGGNCTGYSLPSKTFGSHSYTASFAPNSSSPVDITSTATLASGLTRTVTRKSVPVFEGATAQLFQQPGPAGKDAWIDSWQSSRNHGAQGLIRVGRPGATHGLLEFDVSGLPPAAVVRSATLELNVSWGAGGTVSVHRVLQNWTEGTCTNSGLCFPDGATWLGTQPFVFWTSAGGAHDPAASASAAVTAVGSWISLDVSSLVSAWHQGVPNNGMLLTTTASENEFASGDNNDPTLAPKLTIEYSCECNPLSAGGDIVLQPGPGSGKDTYLSPGSQAGKNFGANPNLWVDEAKPDQVLLEFDFAGLPANAIVTDAQLELYVGSVVDPVNGVLSLHRLTSSWVEGSGANPADGATWNTSDGSIAWSTPGGDFEATPVGSVLIDDATPQWHQWNITSLVSDWTQGAQPNYGLLVRASAGVVKNLDIPSSDHGSSAERPKLTVSYICPCGGACTPPLSVGGNVLMVVADPTNLTTQEITKRALIESWGFSVSLIHELDTQANFDAAFANNDVVFVGSETSDKESGPKLMPSPIGIVSEDGLLAPHLGTAEKVDWHADTRIDVVDTAHYITSPFAVGGLTVLSAGEPLPQMPADTSPDLSSLAEAGGEPSLVALALGAERWDAFGSVDSRRAQLPWGEKSFDVNHLNDDGRTIFRRALEWAAMPASAPAGYLDRFTSHTCDPAVDWIGNNGSLDWSGAAWLPNDGGDPCSGNTQVRLWNGSYRLALEAGADVSRAVDLSGFAGGTLRIRYATQGSFDATSFLRIGMSDDGGASWAELGRIDEDSDGTMMEASYDVSALANADSVIRFGAIGMSAGEMAILDEIALVDETPVVGACAATYLDSLDTFGYDQSYGTLDWSTDWLEINESDGADQGNEQVLSIGGEILMQISDNNGGGEGVEREANLSSASTATLNFKYRRHRFDGESDYVSVDVSDDAGVTWTTLGTLGGAGTDANLVDASYPLDGYLAPQTRIRFLTSPTLGNRDLLFVDEIEICLQ